MLPSVGFIQSLYELQIQVKSKAPYTWVCQKTPNFGFWSWGALILGCVLYLGDYGKYQKSEAVAGIDYKLSTAVNPSNSYAMPSSSDASWWGESSTFREWISRCSIVRWHHTPVIDAIDAVTLPPTFLQWPKTIFWMQQQQIHQRNLFATRFWKFGHNKVTLQANKLHKNVKAQRPPELKSFTPWWVMIRRGTSPFPVPTPCWNISGNTVWDSCFFLCAALMMVVLCFAGQRQPLVGRVRHGILRGRRSRNLVLLSGGWAEKIQYAFLLQCM